MRTVLAMFFAILLLTLSVVMGYVAYQGHGGPMGVGAFIVFFIALGFADVSIRSVK